jgi:hypothetical protein
MRKRIALFGGALFAAGMMQMSDSDSKKNVTFTALVLACCLPSSSGRRTPISGFASGLPS